MPRILVNGIGQQVGLVKDTHAHLLPQNAFTEVVNARFSNSGLEGLRPLRTVLSSASVNPLWLGWFPPTSDPNWIYATNTAIWSYTVAGGHQDITRLAGAYAANGSRWQGGVFLGQGIFNQGEDVPQLWSPMTYGTKLVDLTNWSTFPTYGSNARVKSLRFFKNFLIGLGVGERGGGSTTWHHPYRVQWGNAALPGAVPNTWNPQPDNFANLFDLGETPDIIVDGLRFGDLFFVYKERSTWGLQLSEGSVGLRPFRISDTVGALNQDCMANCPLGQVVVSRDDMVLITGAPEQTPSLLEGWLRKALFASINASEIAKCFMLSVPVRKEIWFFFPGANATYANRVLVWNWESRMGSILEIEETPFAATGQVKENLGDTWATGF